MAVRESVLGRLSACRSLVPGSLKKLDDRAATTVVIVNDKGALLIVFAANYYGQHPRQQADAAVLQLTGHLCGSCDQPHTLESYMDLHGLLPAGGFEKASQQAKEAAEKDLAAAEEHPMLYEGFGWGGVQDVLLSALEDETTDVKVAESADVRKAVPIQVACEITFAEEMGTTKAYWGEPVNQWNGNDSVAFHLKVPGLEKPAIEAWSHGFLKQTASTIVTELEKLGNSITSDDEELLKVHKKSMELGTVGEATGAWFDFVKQNCGLLANDYCGPCLMISSNIGLKSRRAAVKRAQKNGNTAAARRLANRDTSHIPMYQGCDPFNLLAGYCF